MSSEYAVVIAPKGQAKHALVRGRDRVVCGREIDAWEVSDEPYAFAVITCAACRKKVAQRDNKKGMALCVCGHTRARHTGCGSNSAGGHAKCFFPHDECCDEDGCSCWEWRKAGGQ